MLDFILLNATQVASGDAMDSAIASTANLIRWGQRYAVSALVIAILIGGYFLLLGGEGGRRKAIFWFIGAAVGFLLVTGAMEWASSIERNVTF